MLLSLLIGVSVACCRQERPGPVDAEGTNRVPDAIPLLSIREGRGLLFSFFNNRAELKTVDRIDLVARTARSQVMVTDPQTHLPRDLIYVADLTTEDASTQYRVWVESRGTWYDRVVPRSSQISRALLAQARSKPLVRSRARKTSRHSRRARQRLKRERTQPAAVSAQARPSKAPKVILYATAWCPSCRSARSFFKLRGVPFVEVDVEKDARAREQYLSIQQAYRLKPGVVPLIMVNGRPFQGFSQPQIEAALAGGQG